MREGVFRSCGQTSAFEGVIAVGTPAEAGLGLALTRAGDRLDKLVDHPPSLICITPLDGVRHTVRDMISKHLILHALQRRLNRLELCQNVDAVAVFFNHPSDTADLPFDPAKPSRAGFFTLRIHVAGYPPGVYMIPP